MQSTLAAASGIATQNICAQDLAGGSERRMLQFDGLPDGILGSHIEYGEDDDEEIEPLPSSWSILEDLYPDDEDEQEPYQEPTDELQTIYNFYKHIKSLPRYDSENAVRDQDTSSDHRFLQERTNIIYEDIYDNTITIDIKDGSF